MALPVHVPAPAVVLEARVISPAAEMTDAELGQAAAAAVDEHLAKRNASVEAAVRAGELLREARRRCDEQNTSWTDWLNRYWPKSKTTAKRYMAIALEVQHSSGPRADHVEALLRLPSVRACLTDIGYDAGGDREDEQEPETDDAVIERLRGEAESEARPEPAAENKPTRWAPPRGGLAGAPGAKLTPEEIARRAALHKQKADEDAAAEAQSKADRDAIKEAEDRDPLLGPPPPPPPKPQPAPRDPQSVAEDLRRIAGIFEQGRRELLLVTLDVPTPSTAKGLGDAQNSFAPLVERYALLLRQVADEDHEAVTYEADQRAKKNRNASPTCGLMASGSGRGTDRA